MKGIWKIFEFEKFDVLVSKSYNEREDLYAIEFSICLEIGNIATVSAQYEADEIIHAAFDKQTEESVMAFADYIIESLGGHGIFDHGGPDEIIVSVDGGQPTVTLR